MNSATALAKFTTALRARGGMIGTMLGLATARQPAPLLARGAMGLRLRVRPNAFGNALGESLAGANLGGSQQDDTLRQAAQENFRAAEITQQNADAFMAKYLASSSLSNWSDTSERARDANFIAVKGSVGETRINQNSFALSDEGKAFIKKQEGFNLTVYADNVGVATVGWGHKILPTDGLNLGDTITTAQANDFFDRDTRSAIGAANRLIPVGAEQGQFDAAVSLIFNVGEGAFRDSSALQAWRNGDFGSLNVEWMDFNHAGGRVIDALTERRGGELRMFYPYKDRFRMAD